MAAGPISEQPADNDLQNEEGQIQKARAQLLTALVLPPRFGPYGRRLHAQESNHASCREHVTLHVSAIQNPLSRL